MTITPTTTSLDVITHIESVAGSIPAHALPQLTQCIEDGLEPAFIDEAGIETIEQHLEDVLERLEIAIDAAGDHTALPVGRAAVREARAAIKVVTKALNR